MSGGLALGLFVAFTPTFPFQMLLVTAGAVLLKVNLPIALLACWVTNPLTMMPIYKAAWDCGRSILTELAFVQRYVNSCAPQSTGRQIVLNGMYLWTGSFVFATVAAAVGYLVGTFLAALVGGRQRRRDQETTPP